MCLASFKKKKSDSTERLQTRYDKEEKWENGSLSIGTGYVIADSSQRAIEQAAKTFAKPDTYKGNRNLYDSNIKQKAKVELFQSGKEVIDPYTKEKLVLTTQEAKSLYGNEWTKHLAESDHIKPLKQIYNDTKSNVWNTTDDIKAAANSKDNIRIVSKNFNSSKGWRSNKEFIENEEYLQNKSLKITSEGKKQAIIDGDIAEQSINRQLKTASFNNIVKTGHEAGKLGAENAGITVLTMSGIMNFVAVVKGEKDSDEAIEDTIKAGGKAAVMGYAMGGGMTIIGHSLSDCSSKFIQELVKSNIPGKIITAVIVTGDTLKKWGNGDITTQECLIELGYKGLNLATMGYSMAVGQALIPIPIIGGAIGALVGSILTGNYYSNLITRLKNKELEHLERQRIIEECHIAAEQAKVFRQELQAYLDSYFKDYKDCFDMALSSMRFAYQIGDADGVIASANDITRKLGGKVYYETVDQFRDFLDDCLIDIL